MKYIVSFLFCLCLLIVNQAMAGNCNAFDYEIDVLKSLSSMSDLIGHGEHIRMDPDLADILGVEVGDQIRIALKNDNDKYAIYTVTAFYEDGDDNNDVRMALDGRQRLDMSDSFDGCVELTVIRNDLTEAQCRLNNEYGEFLEDDGSQTEVVFTAPHGGVIESYTDEQAEWAQVRVATYHNKDASSWTCKGWQSEIGAFDAWHITSTEINPDQYTELGSIASRGFEYAVSFHGYSGSDILVGGGADTTLKNEVKAAIEDAVDEAFTVTVVSSGEYAGISPDNFVNWLTSSGDNGIQIEQPYSARSGYGQDIAEAVADVFAGKQ